MGKIKIGAKYTETLKYIADTLINKQADVRFENNTPFHYVSCYKCLQQIKHPINVRIDKCDYFFHTSCLEELLQKRISELN